MEKAQKQGQIAAQLVSLDEAIGTLIGVVGQLEERLIPILHNVDEAKNEKEPMPALVPLAEDVRSSTKRVARQSEKLHEILSRIEL